MAVYNVNSDIKSIRFDTGSLFGGTFDRSGVDDAAIIKFVNLGGKFVLVQTNSAYGITSDPYDSTTPVHDYRLIFDGDIAVRTRWDNELDNNFDTGESTTSDYKLDWAKSQFSSLKFQIPSATGYLNESDYTSWTTVVEVATTSDTLNLPFRANEFEVNWVKSFRDAYGQFYDEDNNKNKDTDDAFEYQSVVYNWQYPFGTSNAQYLFGNDTVNGSRNNDVIRGYAGDDLVRGFAGDDLLYADYGRDQLFGGPGDDVLVFGGSSSSWDVDDFAYRTTPIELAVGGSGADMFVFRPSEINWSGRDDVYYEMSLPSLYNGQFKYKKVNDYELNEGFFKVNAAADILNVDAAGKETVVRKAAFGANDNPFQKYQPINVIFDSSKAYTTGTISKLVPRIELPGVTSNDVLFNTFYVDSAGAVFKLSNAANSVHVKVKDAIFTTANNPFQKTRDLDVRVDDDGDIVTTGLTVNTFVKAGQDVVLNNRAGDDDGLISLDTRVYDEYGNVYTRNKSDNWHYNPFLSQSQNDAYMGGATGATRATTDPANGLSNLTQRIKIQDFKIGTDKIDLSAFGLTRDVLLANNTALTGKNGTTYLKALSDVLKTEGLKITSAKNGWTSGNTSLFLKEDAADYNGNGTKDDTLLEIQLVGINISSLNGRFFGESALATGDYEISY